MHVQASCCKGKREIREGTPGEQGVRWAPTGEWYGQTWQERARLTVRTVALCLPLSEVHSENLGSVIEHL